MGEGWERGWWVRDGGEGWWDGARERGRKEMSPNKKLGE